MTGKTINDVKADEAAIELVEHHSENDLKDVYRADVRPEVAKFAIEMETVLRKNDHKTGWRGMEHDTLLRRIRDEFEELRDAQSHISSHECDRSDPAYIQFMRKEAIDIANFCMFLCHNYPKNGD